MATTFDVVYLGNFAPIDPTEGNEIAESASVPAGEEIGRPGLPPYGRTQAISNGIQGYGRGFLACHGQASTAGNDTVLTAGAPDQTCHATAGDAVARTCTDGITAIVKAAMDQIRPVRPISRRNIGMTRTKVPHLRPDRPVRSKMRRRVPRIPGSPADKDDAILRGDRNPAPWIAAVMKESA